MIAYRHNQGLTLIELVSAVAITAIIVSFAAAAYTSVVERVTAQQVRSRINNAFQEARMTAVYGNTIATVCPLDAANRCSNDWTAKVTVFADPDNEKRITAASDIKQVFQLAQSGTVISSSAGSAGRRYFQYNPDGSARGSIGHLIWCPASGESHRAIQARVNFGGRLIWARDSNSDGIVEGSAGDPINCTSV